MPRKRDVLEVSVICRVALAVVCLCASVRSQNRPRIAFEHDGKGVSGFVLYAQPEKGKEIRVDLGPLPVDRQGQRSAELPVLPEGKYHLCPLPRTNPAGESPRVQTAPHRITVAKINAGVPTEAVRPVAATPPPTTDDAASKKTSKPGTLGRLWRVVVGED